MKELHASAGAHGFNERAALLFAGQYRGDRRALDKRVEDACRSAARKPACGCRRSSANPMKQRQESFMPARYALRLMTISVVLMTAAGPSFAKYAEEWVSSANVVPAQAAAQSHVQAAASRTDTSTRNRVKSMTAGSPFSLDPIAAYADDPIAAFARHRTKSALR